jgi:DNA-binding NarL/FixJ family response regulator
LSGPSLERSGNGACSPLEFAPSTLNASGQLEMRLHVVDVLLADDSSTFRHALKSITEGRDNWRVCTEARDGLEAVRSFRQHVPDIVVIDFQMPEMNGLEAAREMLHQSPQVPILMVTMFLSEQLIWETKKIGIKGACAKTDAACVVKGVETLLENKPYFQN